MNGYKPTSIAFSNPINTDRWTIPQKKVIEAPIKIEKNNFDNFLLNKSFESKATNKEVNIIP